jgi:transcriptional regulator with XRE-family HTH domain
MKRNGIRAEMERRSWTYRDLAYASGLSEPHLCRVVNGRRKPSPTALIAIAKALQMAPKTVADMLVEEVAA